MNQSRFTPPPPPCPRWSHIPGFRYISVWADAETLVSALASDALTADDEEALAINPSTGSHRRLFSSGRAVTGDPPAVEREVGAFAGLVLGLGTATLASMDVLWACALAAGLALVGWLAGGELSLRRAAERRSRVERAWSAYEDLRDRTSPYWLEEEHPSVKDVLSTAALTDRVAEEVCEWPDLADSVPLTLRGATMDLLLAASRGEESQAECHELAEIDAVLDGTSEHDDDAATSALRHHAHDLRRRQEDLRSEAAAAVDEMIAAQGRLNQLRSSARARRFLTQVEHERADAGAGLSEDHHLREGKDSR